MTTSQTTGDNRAAVAAPLIPRDALFGNPTRTGGQISPDGKYLSWLAPSEGVLNVWIAPVADPAAGKAITASTDRPIRQYFWAPDARSVLYIQDKGGDENFLLYSVDVATGQERTLTPFEKTRVQIVGTSESRKDTLLVGLNNRDARFHDVHLLDLNTGKLTLVQRNDSYAGFLADDNLKLRMAIRPNARGGNDFFPIVNGTIADKPSESTTLEDSLTTRPAGFTTDGKTMYWIDSRGRNTAALIAQDVATGQRQVIAQNDRADISGILADPKTGVVEAYSFNYLKPEWTATDPEIGQSLAFLRARLQGEFSVQARTDDDSKWVINNDPVSGPTKTYIYDRRAGTLTEFYVSRPELVGMPLQPMHTRELKARDGLTLPSYLTLPPGSDPDGDGRPDRAVPMVLVVHGGPWARDGYGFNATHQWLANRGYAVLSVNFRGSTGFGKDFINAGNLQWGKKMHDDLLDAVAWAVEEGVAQKDKVAIMGGSYGGYAALAGLTFTPDEFACGVSIVGPSNLETLLKSIPPYWEPIIAQFHDRMGNPNTPEGLALIREASPLHKADRIKRPLLIGQGANDPRVAQAESDQIVAAMTAKNIPVTYVLFPDEGHGFAKPANNIAFNAVTENFLGTCLGGRAENIGDALKPSTAKMVTGADYVRGLAAAAGNYPATFREAAPGARSLPASAPTESPMDVPYAIFITGGGSGIGRAIGQLFANRGWFVGLADIDGEALADTAAILPKGRVSTHHLDVRDRDGWDAALAAFAAAAGGRINVVANNAGIPLGGALEDNSRDEIDRCIDINLKGAVYGAQAALPFLRAAAPDACLLNTASAAGIYGVNRGSVYSTTKFGVRSLTESLDAEWSAFDIRVRSLMPAFIDTPLLAHTPNARSNEAIRDQVLNAGLEITPVEQVAQAAWNAVHGDRLHTLVGETARRLAFAARWMPNRLRRMVRSQASALGS